MALTYQELRRFAETSAAVTLLRGDRFVEDIAFLNKTFRSGGNVLIPETELRTALSRWLEATFESDPAQRPDWSVPERIAFYVKQGFLRKREPANQTEPVFELTSDIDRLLAWVEDQRRREFVGTEYGLQAIMRDLREVAARASGNWKQRMDNLQVQKLEIERQMELISSDPEAAMEQDGRYIMETVQRLERASQDLVSDFSVLRERFAELARDVARQQGGASVRRGDVLRLALDGEDALRTTPMGQSFYGFWRMVASSERDEFVEMVRTIYSAPSIPEDVRSRRVLLGLLDRLRDQGQVVLDANRQLTRHVRRALDREEIETRRLMAARVHDLQVLLLGHRDELFNSPKEIDGIEMDEAPKVCLPTDRPLYDPPESMVVETLVRAGEPADVLAAARQIAEAGIVNFGKLVASLDEHISENELKGMTGVMLSTHLLRYPPKNGVIDLLAYLHLAQTLGDNAQVLPNSTFEWGLKGGRKAHLPDALFLSVKGLIK